MNTKRVRIIMWICISVLLVQFFPAGIGKLLGSWADKFADWDYSLAFMYVIGSLEIMGTIGLFFVNTRKWSAILLIIIMAGAAYTHIVNSEYTRVVHNGIIAGFSFLVIQLSSKLKA